jgi:hypothetical protein
MEQQNEAANVQHVQHSDPSPAPSPQPQSPAPGTRVVSESDWAAAQRWRQQYEGSKGLVDAAVKRGFKDPDSFSKLDGLTNVLSRHNLEVDQLGKLLDTAWGSPKADDQRGGGLDPNTLRESGFLTRDDLTREMGRQRAEIMHDQARQSEGKVLEGLRGELLKLGEDERMKFLIEGAFDNAVEKKRSMYPDDHPLRDVDFKPFDEKELRAIYDEVAKKIRIAEAQDAAEVGKAAATQKPVRQPASSPGNHGKPDSENQRRSVRNVLEERAARLPKRGSPTGV